MEPAGGPGRLSARPGRGASTVKATGLGTGLLVAVACMIKITSFRIQVKMTTFSSKKNLQQNPRLKMLLESKFSNKQVSLKFCFSLYDKKI